MSTTVDSDVQRLEWLAEFHQISLSTIYRLAARGELKGVYKVGGQYRVSVPQVLAAAHGEPA